MSKKKKFLQGFFRPHNPGKYNGDLRNIIFRSSWELKMFRWADLNDSVIKWSSETTIIPYRNPIDGNFHRYFVDISLQYKTSNGDIKKFLIEIKPKRETLPPKPQMRKTRRYLKEVQTYLINQAKWQAADKYATERNISFMLFTEQNLGIH